MFLKGPSDWNTFSEGDVAGTFDEVMVHTSRVQLAGGHVKKRRVCRNLDMASCWTNIIVFYTVFERINSPQAGKATVVLVSSLIIHKLNAEFVGGVRQHWHM